MSNAPSIKLIKTKEYEVKQSKYTHVPKLPLRSMIVGPSGCGKAILLQNLILDIYTGCFARIYIWSPSINIDHTWDPVKQYMKMKYSLAKMNKYILTATYPMSLKM